MEKVVRVYYSTFIDVLLDTDIFSTEDEMIDYAEENTEDFLSLQEINDNLCKQEGESEIIDI